jgi:predicted patatin/cPLA2 family phospholipase
MSREEMLNAALRAWLDETRELQERMDEVEANYQAKIKEIENAE